MHFVIALNYTLFWILEHYVCSIYVAMMLAVVIKSPFCLGNRIAAAKADIWRSRAPFSLHTLRPLSPRRAAESRRKPTRPTLGTRGREPRSRPSMNRGRSAKGQEGQQLRRSVGRYADLLPLSPLPHAQFALCIIHTAYDGAKHGTTWSYGNLNTLYISKEFLLFKCYAV